MVDHAGIWFSGPQFLYDCATGWPNQPDFLRELHDDDPEIKPAKACMAQIPLETKDCLNRLFERYSDLRSLLLSVCWMLRFGLYLKWNCTLGWSLFKNFGKLYGNRVKLVRFR